MDTEKRRENHLRKLANRQGCGIKKSRVRNPHLNDRGFYMIIDPYFNSILAGEKFDMTLDEVEAYFAE